MNDVRDEALGVALDGVARVIEAEPADRLPEVLRRGSRKRAARFTAIGAAVAVFVGAISWTGLAIRGDERIPADVADWRTFASLEDNGWTVQVPPSWKVQELPSCPNAPDRIGVIVTNTDFEFRNPRGESPQCEDRFVFEGFPSDGVALAFMPVGIRFGIVIPQLDTVFPLSTELMTRTDSLSGGASESFLGIWKKEINLSYVRRWEGPEASTRDVEALDRMLAWLQVRGAPRWIEDEVTPVDELSDLRVTLVHPSGWDLRTFPRWSVIDAPNPIAALTSPGIRNGSCRPYLSPIRLSRFTDQSVLVLISDATDSWVSPDLPARPVVLRFQDAIQDEKGRCGGDVRALRFGFEAAGRQIYIDILANEAVYRRQPEMLAHILNSIRVSEA